MAAPKTYAKPANAIEIANMKKALAEAELEHFQAVNAFLDGPEVAAYRAELERLIGLGIDPATQTGQNLQLSLNNLTIARNAVELEIRAAEQRLAPPPADEPEADPDAPPAEPPAE